MSEKDSTDADVCYENAYESACEDWDFIREYEFGCARQQFEAYLECLDDGICMLSKGCLRELDVLFNYFSLSRPIFGETKEAFVRKMKPIYKKVAKLDRFFRDAMGLVGQNVYDIWQEY